MSRWIVDASLSLSWFLKDEEDRANSLDVLAGIRENDVIVPLLWNYEVSNGLVSAYRRRRITFEEISEITASLAALPIATDTPNPHGGWDLPRLALRYELTAYDAAYLELALRLALPIAIKDAALRRAMETSGVKIVHP